MNSFSIPERQRLESLIKQRRRQILVHRILYYVFDSPIIDDFKYTQWEDELIQLIKDYPELARISEYGWFNPEYVVGSDDINSYPANLIWRAKWLLEQHKKEGK